jgi:hypothetical protein
MLLSSQVPSAKHPVSSKSSTNHTRASQDSKAPSRLKDLAFEMYKLSNWPAQLGEECASYTHDGSCVERGIDPCLSCATFDRLVEEFQAIPVG